MKRADGRWQVTIELSPNFDGSRNRKVFYGKTAQAAHSQADKFRAHQRLGIMDLDDRTTVAQFADHWLTHTVPLTCIPNTAAGYRDLLHRHALPIIGRMRLLEVQPMHIESVLTAVADRGLRANTVKAVRRVLSSLFTAAARNSLIPNNPVQKTRQPRPRQNETSRKPVAYDVKEFQRLVTALDGHPREVLFLWSALTGMRRGEVLAVRWCDITFDDEGGASVNVDKQIKEERVAQGDGSFIVMRAVTKPKTENSVRTVTLPPQLVPRLHDLRAQQRSGGKGRGWSEEEFIFATDDGQPLWPSNVSYAWTQFLKKAGLRHMALHGLRHTFAQLALANDAPLEAVSEALGHHSISITKDMYANKVPGLAKKATKAVADLIPKDISGARGLNHGVRELRP